MGRPARWATSSQVNDSKPTSSRTSRETCSRWSNLTLLRSCVGRLRGSRIWAVTGARLPSLLRSSVQAVLDERGDHVPDALETLAVRLTLRVPEVDALEDHGQFEVGQTQVESQFADVTSRTTGVPLDRLVGGEVARSTRSIGHVGARLLAVEGEVLVGQHDGDVGQR